MAIEDVNPFFSEMKPVWQFCRHSYQGPRAIKARGKEYLPPTEGMCEDGYPTPRTLGWYAYQSYKDRAFYPEIYTEAVEASVGIMHREPAVIEVPSVLESMMTDATPLSESLHMVLRNINTQQLMTGRLGLLADIRTIEGVPKPLLLIYKDTTIRNWNDTSPQTDNSSLQMVVLDESNYYLDNSTFSWSYKNKYRLLALVDSMDDQRHLSSTGTYMTRLFEKGNGITLNGLEAPHVRGRELDQIPFSFINAKDIASNPDKPPLEGLAELCKAIYQGEADYRQNLHMQSQDTLVTIGGTNKEEPQRLGTGAKINVPLGGDAKFIGVSSSGLPEQRQSLDNDYTRAYQKAGQLISSQDSSNESGLALRIRVAAQTASYPIIAQAGAAGLEKVLKSLAVWYGANPNEVIVQPNLDFTEEDLNGQTLVQILQSKGLGAPISNESIHAYLRDRGYTKKTYDEELNAMSQEEP